MTAKVLGIANQKGGVGKTTTALSLAGALGEKGLRVLVMDLDPHCCASVQLRYYPGTVDASVHDLFVQPGAPDESEPESGQTPEMQDAQDPGTPDYPALWPAIIKTPEGLGFDFAPAAVQLADLDGDLKNRPGKGNILNEAIEPLRGQYDYIILDCPPHLGILLVNAMVASDLLIVPIQTDFLAVHGLKLLVDTVKILNKALPEPLDFRALPTMFDKRAKACAKVLELLHTKMHERVFETIIGMDTKFRDASANGTVITKLAPSSRGALAYKALAEEICTLW